MIKENPIKIYILPGDITTFTGDVVDAANPLLSEEAEWTVPSIVQQATRSSRKPIRTFQRSHPG